MKTKKRQDILDRFAKLQKRIVGNRPSLFVMRQEVQMMNFKIRPVHGNIALVDLNNNQLIEILWNLGKLEEFYRREVKQITRQERIAFFAMFDRLYGQLQASLNRINLRSEILVKGADSLELEIFKEKPKVN